MGYPIQTEETGVCWPHSEVMGGDIGKVRRVGGGRGSEVTCGVRDSGASERETVQGATRSVLRREELNGEKEKCYLLGMRGWASSRIGASDDRKSLLELCVLLVPRRALHVACWPAVACVPSRVVHIRLAAASHLLRGLSLKRQLWRAGVSLVAHGVAHVITGREVRFAPILLRGRLIGTSRRSGNAHEFDAQCGLGDLFRVHVERVHHLLEEVWDLPKAVAEQWDERKCGARGGTRWREGDRQTCEVRAEVVEGGKGAGESEDY